jgi:hypothetical protein
MSVGFFLFVFIKIASNLQINVGRTATPQLTRMAITKLQMLPSLGEDTEKMKSSYTAGSNGKVSPLP